MENLYMQKSSNGIALVPYKSKFYEKRVLFIDKAIDKESVSEIYQQMLMLSMEDKSKPITLVFNSSGGSVREGLVLLDVMDAIPNRINAVALGACASMAAVILSNATKGYRYVSQNSTLLVHEPLIVETGGSCSNLEQTSKELIKTRDKLNKLLSNNTGKDLEEINELTKLDKWLNSEEALEFGIVDKILENEELFNLLTGREN